MDHSRRLDAIPEAIMIDDSARVHLAGGTRFAGLIATASSQQAAHSGGFRDGFWITLDAGINQVIHSSYLGGAGDDYIHAIRLLSNQHIALAGSTSSIDFPVTALGELPNVTPSAFLAMGSIKVTQGPALETATLNIADGGATRQSSARHRSS
jgi:hypothetical protein